MDSILQILRLYPQGLQRTFVIPGRLFMEEGEIKPFKLTLPRDVILSSILADSGLKCSMYVPNRAIGKIVRVTWASNEITGKLIEGSLEDQEVVLETKSGLIRILNPSSILELEEYGEDRLPTCTLTLRSGYSINKDYSISVLQWGVYWRNRAVGVYNKSKGSIRIVTTAKITNSTLKAYESNQLTFVNRRSKFPTSDLSREISGERTLKRVSEDLRGAIEDNTRPFEDEGRYSYNYTLDMNTLIPTGVSYYELSETNHEAKMFYQHTMGDRFNSGSKIILSLSPDKDGQIVPEGILTIYDNTGKYVGISSMDTINKAKEDTEVEVGKGNLTIRSNPIHYTEIEEGEKIKISEYEVEIKNTFNEPVHVMLNYNITEWTNGSNPPADVRKGQLTWIIMVKPGTIKKIVKVFSTIME